MEDTIITSKGSRNVGRCLNEQTFHVESVHPITRDVILELRKEKKLGYGQSADWRNQGVRVNHTHPYFMEVVVTTDSSD